MKTDTYIKVMLTVIAVFLGIIVVKDFDSVRTVYASQSDISYCWDGAFLIKVSDYKWKIKTYCQYYKLDVR